ncbi:transcription termination factor NusA [Schleiferia thermophila]|jgi:N utilization substance protein A|uniref:Transcription termination/antitermination protein NusA n=1 Tax=Schleiferia thermophila TaxID=884107 RepID=A0A369A3E1_9FLAO|nr:transcription termination factor NusA [Schleiferia thermophila]KFD39664.1 transcription elongation factor NusA [Schleiferia thermophila str. Yellowstone]PMB13339.1 transcription termination/antitermination protein NusA [Fischerella thermalis CCMEE 5319]RCX03832.1 NusA antitermination factor [Schleiferia thermophila]GCD80064.1 transcription termination/antitermination protein NusA [Schleiferia thermophila]
MENIGIIESFAEFKDEKNIDRATLMAIIEEAFRAQLKKKFGTDENFQIIVNPDKGDLEIWKTRTIVADDDVEDPNLQVGLSEALKVEPDFEIGEELTEEVKLQDLGRRFVLAFKQTLASKIMEHDSGQLYKKYKDLEGEIVTGEVHHVRPKAIIVLDDDGNELILPKDQQIPSDYFRKGDTVRAVVKQVEIRGNKPQVIISRTDPRFLEKLFEQEIPEVFDGLILIKKVVRIPGEKAKVAVESLDDRIDPVGACVGMKGSRIHSIVKELGNENIDVINYTQNLQLLISRALAPAKISYMNIDEENRRVDVYLKPDQVSLAIGKNGQNIKLASQLVGMEIDVYREATEEDEDVELDEFADEIEPWIIEEFKKIGCDTAKSVLALSVEELVNRTDLEEETIQEVRKILSAEFE